MKIDEHQYKTYKCLSNSNKFIWTMTNGSKSKKTDHKHTKLYEGQSVSELVDKNNPNDIFYALEEFQAIRSSISDDKITIYTDGSKTCHGVGSGSIIYKGKKCLQKLVSRLTNCENNTAELYAIHQSLEWARHNIKCNDRKVLHIFSDSRYSINCLTGQSQVTAHKTLVDEIQVMVNDMSSEVFLHWIPSHIEIQTSNGKRNIVGNYEADALANKATQLSSIPLDYKKSYTDRYPALRGAAAKLVYSIDRQLHRKWESWNSQNASPSQDDFSQSDAQQILSENL